MDKITFFEIDGVQEKIYLGVKEIPYLYFFLLLFQPDIYLICQN